MPLLFWRQIAVERQQLGGRKRCAKQLQATFNVGLSGQKHKYVAVVVVVCLNNG